ncbi:MAG: hypothetical protein GY754_32035 [bacterium]|nr:hypothetical protein [bacterium]
MSLSIPTNFSEDFFDKVDLSATTEIFGKLSSDYIGGGRASVLINKTSKKKFLEHVDEITKRGITFNYLLNATCMSNLEFTRKGHKKIRKLLDFISENNIPMVTVGLPQLAKLITTHYPSLKISVSTNAMVDCLERVKYWEDLGVDQITISYTDLNRDFKEIKRITDNSKVEIQTICNFICRRHCPQQFFHGAYNSHASQTNSMNKLLPVDYYLLNCISRFFTNPYEIIRSSYIRPEDLHYYEKVGMNKFKLGERGYNTTDLARIVKAYTDRSYDGNVVDIIPTMSKYKVVTEPSVKHVFKHVIKPTKIKFSKLIPAMKSFTEFMKNEEFYKNIGMYFDNKALDGFMEHFINNDCHDKTCEECKYCDSWAKKAIQLKGYDEATIDPVKVIGDIRDGLAVGSFFK